MSGFSKDFWDFWAKVARKSLNLSLFSVVFIALAFSACGKKHTPQSKEELKELVRDESVYLGDIDTRDIFDMSELFAAENCEVQCREIRTDFSGIELWDTSSVKTMRRMFWEATHFNQPLDKWDTSSVEDMSGMFYQAKSFNQPVQGWDTGAVRDMSLMFAGAEAFNQPLNLWNVENVEDMHEMFSFAISFNQPLDLWDISKVRDMSAMFRHARNFKQGLNSWGNLLKEDTNTENIFVKSPLFKDKTPKWLKERRV